MNKPSGTERLADASLAGTTATAQSTNENLTSATAWLLTVVLTFNGAATEGAILRLYPTYDGANFDTEPWDDWYWPIDVRNAGVEEIRTSPPLNVSPKGCKFDLYNLDSEAITGISVKSTLTSTG